RELAALGVDHFGLYLQHDAQDATLSAFGEQVIPAVNEHVLARP
ncbi:MAG: TIGR03842 family LLM class F420-dependent oxidoreductase, partial [Actinomycetota bacterium]|nr:TIGR03842 family LLM class F420-dependent oxidoreductase [Actinomycetota bacterium]